MNVTTHPNALRSLLRSGRLGRGAPALRRYKAAVIIASDFYQSHGYRGFKSDPAPGLQMDPSATAITRHEARGRLVDLHAKTGMSVNYWHFIRQVCFAGVSVDEAAKQMGLPAAADHLIISGLELVANAVSKPDLDAVPDVSVREHALTAAAG